MMLVRKRGSGRYRRRGVTAVMVVVSLSTLFAFAALTVDVGQLFSTRTELQRSSDAASLAGTLRLMDENRLRGDGYLAETIESAREVAAAYAGLNKVGRTALGVASGDLAVGYLRDPTDPTESMDYSDPSRYNAVRVHTRRDDVSNGPISLTFAWIFGHKTANVTASATAAMMDGVAGYRVTDETGNAILLPLALHVDWWEFLLAGIGTSGDNYSYDPGTGAVTPGPDGVEEINLYPGAGIGALPPGNLGTVDIGPSGNATSDISRQILEGVSKEDLDYFGGELRFGSDGTLPLNGETGLSAAIAEDLKAIIGQARSIPLFNSVNGPGNNATFTIVGFGGIRVMHVKLTGAMALKKVIIQPAIVIDDAVLTGPATGSSYLVYQPVRIVR